MPLTTPTFIIGLGGIGQKVTFLLADRFHNSRWGGVPPTIRLRAIDTAPEEKYEIPISRYRHFTQVGIDPHPNLKLGTTTGGRSQPNAMPYGRGPLLSIILVKRAAVASQNCLG